MSSKIDQPTPFPVIVKTDHNAASAKIAPAPQTERSRSQQHTPSSTTSSRRYPAPQDLQKPLPPLFAALEMEKEDLAAFDTVLADQVTFEITQLYSVIESISQDNSSLEVKQGLKALEEQIRLREYLHAKRTVINKD